MVFDWCVQDATSANPSSRPTPRKAPQPQRSYLKGFQVPIVPRFPAFKESLQKRIRIITANCASNSSNIAEFTDDVTSKKYTGIAEMVSNENVTTFLSKCLQLQHFKAAYKRFFKVDPIGQYTVAQVFGNESPRGISVAHSEHMTLQENRMNLLTQNRTDKDIKMVITLYINGNGRYFPQFDARIPVKDVYTIADEKAYKGGKVPDVHNINMIRLWDMCLSIAVAYKFCNDPIGGLEQIREWQGDMTGASKTLNNVVEKMGPDIVCAQEYYKDVFEIERNATDTAKDDVCLLSRVESSAEVTAAKALFEARAIGGSKSVKTSLLKTAALVVPMGADKMNVLVLGCHWKSPEPADTITILEAYRDAARELTEGRWIAVGDFNFEEKKLGKFMEPGALTEALKGLADVHFWTNPPTGELCHTTSKCRTLASTQADKIGVKAQSAKDGFITSPGLLTGVTVKPAVRDILNATNMSDHMFMQLEGYCTF